MKTIVPARDSEIATLAAKTSPSPSDARSKNGSRSRALGWVDKGGLVGVVGLLACAMALPIGCGSSDTGSGSGGATSASSADSTSSAGGSSGNGGSTSASTTTSAGTTTSASATTSTSATTSATTSTSTSSTSTSATSSTSTGGMVCPPADPGEPNNDVGQAYPVGTLTCKDTDVHAMHGTLAGSTDVDWFFYEGQDSIGCLVNPTVSVVSTTGPLQVCSYFFCTAGTAAVTCPAGTMNDKDPFGDPGCCGAADSNYTVNLDCTGTTNGSASVYLRVTDPTSSAVCTDYDLTFHY